MKIVIMGSTGVGKTTLGKQLSTQLDIPFVELDNLFWLEDWQGRSKSEFQDIVGAYASTESWIMDGNYESVRTIIWSEADTLIWLDYSFSVVFYRLVKRILLRAISKEVVCGNNIDNGWVHLKLWSKDSLINWLFQTYWKRKEEMPRMIANDGSHLRVIRISCQKDLDVLLNSLLTP